MLLLNAIALVGLATLLVPILIHLQKRRKSREIAWAAMRFLRQSIELRRRGLTLENLLLLFCRCLLVALFVVAMSRPVVDSLFDLRLLIVSFCGLASVFCLAFAIVWPSRIIRFAAATASIALLFATALVFHYGKEALGVGTENCDLAIVLDSSLTMNITENGTSRFAAALEEAQQLVKRLSGKSTVSIVVAGPTTQTVEGSPFRNLNRAGQQMRELKPSTGGGNLREAIDRAQALIEKESNDNKQVIVFSDNQLTAWDSIAADDNATPRDDADDDKEFSDQEGNQDSPKKRRLFGRQANLPIEMHNLAVTRLRNTSPLPTLNRPLGFEIEILNSGTATVHGRSVQLWLDEQQVASQPIPQLEPNTRTIVRFTQKFTSSGPHVVRAEIQDADLLPDDNRLESVVSVIDQVPILVVDGNTSEDRSQHSAVFASLALDPQSLREKDEDSDKTRVTNGPSSRGGRAIRAERCTLESFANRYSADDLNGFQAILLCDAPKLPASVSSQLASYVEQGGSLWIILDSTAEPTFYNSWIGPSTRRSVAPGKLLTARQLDEHEPPIDALDLESVKQSAMKSMVERGEHDLGLLAIVGCRSIEPRTESTVSLQLTSGKAMILEQTLGRGRVLLQSISLLQSDSNLISLVSFPVVMHLWTEYLAAKDLPEFNYTASPNLIVELPNSEPLQQAVQLKTPGGDERAVHATVDHHRLIVDAGDAADPGVYRLRFASDEKGFPFSVVREPSESELTITTAAKLKELNKDLGIEWITSPEDLLQVGQSEFGRKELWKWLLYATIWLLVIETLVARWIVRGRSVSSVNFAKPTGSEPAVPLTAEAPSTRNVTNVQSVLGAQKDFLVEEVTL